MKPEQSHIERLREYAPLFVEEAAANIRAAADRLEQLERQLAAPLSAELPELPPHKFTSFPHGWELLYTAEQMQEYARAAQRAAPQEAPQQEPVAWYEQTASGEWFLAYSFNPNAVTKPLYFAAPISQETK